MSIAHMIEKIDNTKGYLTDEQVEALEEITGFTNEIYRGNFAYSFYCTESQYYDKTEYFNPDNFKNIHDDLKAAGLPPIDINYDIFYELPNDQWDYQDVLDFLHEHNLCTDIVAITDSNYDEMYGEAAFFVRSKVDEILCKVNDYVDNCEKMPHDNHGFIDEDFDEDEDVDFGIEVTDDFTQGM